jgi:hypothetical protein
MIDCDCPHCGSRNTKAFSVLHGDGTRTSRYRKDGLFYYRGSFGLNASTVRGQSQSLTAQRAAPPSAALSPGLVVAFLVIGALLGGATGFWVAVAVSVLLAACAGAGEDAAHGEWSMTFRCGRCGTVFAVIEEAASSGQLSGKSSVAAQVTQKR